MFYIEKTSEYKINSKDIEKIAIGDKYCAVSYDKDRIKIFKKGNTESIYTIDYSKDDNAIGDDDTIKDMKIANDRLYVLVHSRYRNNEESWFNIYKLGDSYELVKNVNNIFLSNKMFVANDDKVIFYSDKNPNKIGYYIIENGVALVKVFNFDDSENDSSDGVHNMIEYEGYFYIMTNKHVFKTEIVDQLVDYEFEVVSKFEVPGKKIAITNDSLYTMLDGEYKLHNINNNMSCTYSFFDEQEILYLDHDRDDDYSIHKDNEFIYIEHRYNGSKFRIRPTGFDTPDVVLSPDGKRFVTYGLSGTDSTECDIINIYSVIIESDEPDDESYESDESEESPRPRSPQRPRSLSSLSSLPSLPSPRHEPSSPESKETFSDKTFRHIETFSAKSQETSIEKYMELKKRNIEINNELADLEKIMSELMKERKDCEEKIEKCEKVINNVANMCTLDCGNVKTHANGCGHVFCKNCWDNSNACPMCRAEIKNLIRLYL